MKIHKLPIQLIALIIGVLISCTLGHAEDASSFAKVITVDGHYEYNKDGVPILGIVTASLPAKLVKFTT
jgi:hypothetical protein